MSQHNTVIADTVERREDTTAVRCEKRHFSKVDHLAILVALRQTVPG
jgi:hypothetical protein